MPLFHVIPLCIFLRASRFHQEFYSCFQTNIQNLRKTQDKTAHHLSQIKPVSSLFSHITVPQSLFQFKVCLSSQKSPSSDLHYSSLHHPTLPVLIFFSDSTYILSHFFPVGFHILPKLCSLHSLLHISFSFFSHTNSFDHCVPFCLEVLDYDLTSLAKICI